MLVFAKILKWITDPKNRTIILFIFISLLIALFFYQRNRTQKFKFQYEEEVKETSRVTNNWTTSLDSITQIRNRNGVLTGEISGFVLTVDEFRNRYDSIFTLYDHELKKPPKVIIQWKWKIVDITKIPTFNQGDTLITFHNDTTYDTAGENWRKLNVEIPYSHIYKLKPDSSNSFTFDKALRYAFALREKENIKDAFVVVYKNNKRVSYSKVKSADSLIYRVQIFASNSDFSDTQIIEKFNLNENDTTLFKSYEDGKYKYMIGMFIPSPINEKIISDTELYTYSKIITQHAITNLSIGMSVSSELYKDPVTGKISIKINTPYPGVTFKDIDGAEIMSAVKDNKKVARSFRKEFSVGLHIGVGAFPVAVDNAFKMKFGPVMSVGINYSPRWLQFGASQKGKNSINDFINGE